MTPTIGRIVHYRGEDLRTYAAIITSVNDASVDLTIFEGPRGVLFIPEVPLSESQERRTCWWPPLVSQNRDAS